LSGSNDLKEMPHYDTLNNYLEKLDPQVLSCLRKKMVKSLIRSKVFYKARLCGKYWRVILDGTGLFYFKERHCEQCLMEKEAEKMVRKNIHAFVFVYWYYVKKKYKLK
jgi:hypothetical protein